MTKGVSPIGDDVSSNNPGEIVGKDKAKHIAIGIATVAPAAIGGTAISLALITALAIVAFSALGIAYAVIMSILQF